jgi:hypothetical protein
MPTFISQQPTSTMTSATTQPTQLLTQPQSSVTQAALVNNQHTNNTIIRTQLKQHHSQQQQQNDINANQLLLSNKDILLKSNIKNKELNSYLANSMYKTHLFLFILEYLIIYL